MKLCGKNFLLVLTLPLPQRSPACSCETLTFQPTSRIALSRGSAFPWRPQITSQHNTNDRYGRVIDARGFHLAGDTAEPCWLAETNEKAVVRIMNSSIHFSDTLTLTPVPYFKAKKPIMVHKVLLACTYSTLGCVYSIFWCCFIAHYCNFAQFKSYF